VSRFVGEGRSDVPTRRGDPGGRAAGHRDERPRDAPRGTPRDAPRDAPRGTPSDAPRDTPRGAPTDTPIDKSIDIRSYRLIKNITGRDPIPPGLDGWAASVIER